MFAVIKTGGKQYKVASGNVLSVEKLAAAAGDTVQFNDVLMLGAEGDVTVGAPLVADAGVQAEVLDQTRGPKTISFKRRRRKSSSARRKGHRQDLTVVRITEILANGADKSGVAAALGAGSAPRAIEAAAPAPKAEKKAAPKKEAKAEVPAEAPAAGGAAPANLTDAPEASDKLTTFAGVGPKMAEKLNALGVHNFAQIAAWTEAEAAWIDEQAGLKGKIIADDWIGQAKAKAEEN